MDEHKPDILSEIFDKIDSSTPPPQRPRFEYPPEDGPDPPASVPPPPLNGAGGTGTAGNHRTVTAKLLPWLCLMLGAAALALGICTLQTARLNQVHVQ